MYFAKIDSNNLVTTVIVAEQAYIDAQAGTWVQTDIAGISPLNYAGKGYTWNAVLNGFVAPKPYPSWILDNNTCKWNAPVTKPTDGKKYIWDESTVSWTVLMI